VPRSLPRFLVRRAAFALLLVAIVSSSALIVAALAPPDTAFESDPAAVAAERQRLGLDRPVLEQYGAWVGRVARLDLGESLRYRRPVTVLIRESAGHTLALGISALLLATAIGIPAGVYTGSARRRVLPAVARTVSLIVLSVPPLVGSLILLVAATRTGWPPVSGLLLPTIALALPIAALLERQQSQALREALGEPSILAALARGVARPRVVWRHAFRLSLKPVLAIYGIVVGSTLSGSFAVEIVMARPGLGALTFEALRARDIYLMAGCAAVGAAFLAVAILASDLALAAADPRAAEPQ
jgi:ABC-type dipeptide/oligopeptide/nickel transport system permease component